MKQKRFALKTVAFLVYIAISVALLIHLQKKSRITNGFGFIMIKVNQQFHTNKTVPPEVLISCCDSLRSFVENNNIETEVEFNCETLVESTNGYQLKRFQTDLRAKAKIIYGDLRRQQDIARWIMFIGVILLQGGMFLVGKMINKKFKD